LKKHDGPKDIIAGYFSSWSSASPLKELDKPLAAFDNFVLVFHALEDYFTFPLALQ
jgi:hypothetical protein